VQESLSGNTSANYNKNSDSSQRSDAKRFDNLVSTFIQNTSKVIEFYLNALLRKPEVNRFPSTSESTKHLRKLRCSSEHFQRLDLLPKDCRRQEHFGSFSNIIERFVRIFSVIP